MVNRDELARRKALTFEQAEGLVELPRQLRPDELPNVVRAKLLRVVVESIEGSIRPSARYSLGPQWKEWYKAINVEYLGQVSAKFSSHPSTVIEEIEARFQTRKPHQVLGWIQALLRIARDRSLSQKVAKILEEDRCAYRLIDGDTLMPIASEAEAQTISTALASTASSGLSGANQHLKKAGGELSSGKFADSIRESIHAVEPTLRSITGEPSVSKALIDLQKRRPMHEAFKMGVNKLYGFGSDEPGVRHPLLEKGDAAVTEEDALVMLGICAALVSYFTRAYAKPTA